MRRSLILAVMLLLILTAAREHIPIRTSSLIMPRTTLSSHYINSLQSSSPNFTMTVTPLSQSIPLGEQASYQIKLNSTNNFSGVVTLQTISFPQELIKAFNPPNVTLTANATNTSTLTVNSILAGEPYYEFTVQGTSGSIKRTVNISLTLRAESPPLTPASIGFLAAIVVFAAIIVWYGLRNRRTNQSEETVETGPKPPPV